MRKEVAEAVERASSALYGNPSSLHWAGRAARALLEESRERIAGRLGVPAAEIVFTSGGTEANRLAVLGALAGAGSAEEGAHGSGRGEDHAVVSAIEHPSTLDLFRQLVEEGRLAVTWVRPGTGGRVDPLLMAASIRSSTRLVSLMHSNNETGVIQDLQPLAEACRKERVPLHSDAVQSLGKIPLRPGDLGADLLSISSHKIGGPRGVGALWVRGGCRFRPPHRGGPQERGYRPGTEALPAVAGFACAVELMEPMGSDPRERLWEGIRSRVPEAVLNGDPEHLLPNTLNISFPGISAELLLIRLDLDGLAASSGSACASGARNPSHVLEAMGHPAERVGSAVRLSLGWTTTGDEIDRAAEVIGRALLDLRRGAMPAPRGAGAYPRSAPGTLSTAPGTAPGRA